jgi:hypothetical protein
MCARPVAALTLAFAKPSICCSERVMSQLQAAQVMPSSASITPRPPGSARVRASVSAS